ncbi:hypothetical protein I4U23_005936 [Adineta vaga]|nr:hypothetical protein I4U23_005936 [Adineta vaga]
MDINLSEENSNFETYCLIWLDASVNETQENRETQIKLRSFVNHLDIFQDDQLCLNYIKSLPRGDRGDYQLSLEWYKKALNIKQQTLSENDLSIASTYGNIANIYGILKDYKNALESYEKAMNIYEQNSGKEQLYIASCLNNMALECYQKSFDIRQECCHDNHHHLGTSYNNLGIIYSILNNNDQALKHLHKSLEIFKICFSTKHPKTISILENIGIIYENQGDFEQALVYYQKAEQLYRKIYHSTDPNILRLEKRIQNVSIDLFDELT